APVDRDTIFQQTGWYRAPDMNWKFVIPDRDANLRHGNLISGTIQSGPKAGQQVVAPKPGLRLEDVLFHPTLFRSYPYLRNVKLDLLPQDKWGTSAGGYERSTGTIYLAPLAESELLPTLLHETQHVIQNAEGFARGGSPREFLRPDWGSDFATVQAQMNAIRQTIQSIGVDPAEVAAVHGITGAPVTAITPQMQKNASKVPPFVIQKMKDATNKWNQLAQERRAAIQTYLNLGGEVESRVVERMLHNRNWDQPPWQAGEMLLQGGGAQPIPYTPESQQDIRFRPQTVPQP
ncbi:MAG: hypothetical protein J2P48_19700, partial [Alphaproteobacteria bacterium]|nr:hypothetical protein [Alphaproteobacteria bacterium]